MIKQPTYAGVTSLFGGQCVSSDNDKFCSRMVLPSERDRVDGLGLIGWRVERFQDS